MMKANKTFECASCPSMDTCAWLKATLNVLKEQNLINKSLQARVRDLTAQISAAGFSYPDGTKPCDLVNRNQLIRDLTDQCEAVLEENFYQTHVID